MRDRSDFLNAPTNLTASDLEKAQWYFQRYGSSTTNS